MARISVNWATWLYATVVCCTIASAVEPLDFFEVVKVNPSRVITHDVSLKGRFDNSVVQTDLTGPKFFSRAVGFGEETARERDAYFNWYEIRKPPRETQRFVPVRDSLQAGTVYMVRIGAPSFLLSPARRLTSGPPAPVSDRLSYFKAYRIVSGEPINKEVKLTNTLGPETRTAVRPALLCVPAEQWHHAEHSPIKRAKHCLVVYELQVCEHSATISTLDQFGLNELDVESSVWLCVPAEIAVDTTRTRK
jgi:hypothetical protein